MHVGESVFCSNFGGSAFSVASDLFDHWRYRFPLVISYTDENGALPVIAARQPRERDEREAKDISTEFKSGVFVVIVARTFFAAFRFQQFQRGEGESGVTADTAVGNDAAVRFIGERIDETRLRERILTVLGRFFGVLSGKEALGNAVHWGDVCCRAYEFADIVSSDNGGEEMRKFRLRVAGNRRHR